MEPCYFEDVEPGTRLESGWYAVEPDEIIEFARRWDPYDFHLDEEAAKASVFGGLAACTAHIFAIASILAHDLPKELVLVAGLGGDGLQLLAPVRAGSRVRLVRVIRAVRDSKSRPETGIVTIEDTLEWSEGEALYRTSGSMLVARRPS